METDLGPAASREEAAVRGMTLAWWAGQGPDRPAILSAHGDRTFGQLNERANQLSRALRRRGLVGGDAVALLCTNRPEFSETVAACQRSGFRLTPINWHLSAGEAAYIISDCGARAVIASVELADTAVEAAAGAPSAVVRVAVGGAISGFDRYDDIVGVEDSADLDDAVLGTQMLYTSGTTGRPKGVYRSPELARAIAAAPPVNLYGYREGSDDLHLCTGPLYHAAPLAFSLSLPLAFGVGVVLMDQWEPEETLRLIERHRITHTHMVPTMFHRLLSLPADVREKYDLSSLRMVLHGAAPCPVPIKRRMIDWVGPIILEYYAATEGVGTWSDSATWLARPGTVGRAMVAGQVKVGDEDGNPLPAGQIGLVYLRSPSAGRFEYFGDQAKTDGVYRDEYFTLGDMGYLDEDGYLFLTDRAANLIISGGVNIYPAEVEAVLLEHPAVGDVAVIGIPSDEWGEEVRAVVEPQPGVPSGPELAAELVTFTRERMAHFKCPRAVDFVERLPRQDNGKIYKRLLRDEYRRRASDMRQ
jgi:long-chain acyl-CoA synthetase